MALGPKEQAIMDFLHQRIFDPILNSPTASASLKQGVRLTIMRMEQRDAAGMIAYYWSAIIGTEPASGSPPECDKRALPASRKRLRSSAFASIMISYDGREPTE